MHSTKPGRQRGIIASLLDLSYIFFLRKYAVDKGNMQRKTEDGKKVCTLPVTSHAYRVSATSNLVRQLRLEVSILEISSFGDIPKGVLLYARSVFDKNTNC